MYEWVDNPASIDPTFSLLPQDEQQAILAILKRARDDLTTTSPITAGSMKKSPQVSETIRLPKTAQVLRQLSPKELDERLADFTAEELAQCNGCDGMRCGKDIYRWQVPELYSDNGRLERRYVDCKFKAQMAFRRAIRSSRIPERYLGKTFADYKVDNSNRAAVEFAKNIFNLKRGAYFYGACGTGKTFLASIIAQEFMRAGKSAVFVKVPSLLDDIKATFNGNGTELALLDKLQTANLVVLDDFGMEVPTQWAGSTLCKILDMRYDNPTGKTIVTSNLSPDELATHLNKAKDGANLNGSRIFDRLSEICKPILLKGTTRRN